MGRTNNMFIDVQNIQPATGLGLLVAILVFVKLASVIHTAYFSPLARVPGPALAKVTDLWLLWQLYNYRKCPALEDCFRKYGSIVRIGPNKLAVNSEESMIQILLFPRLEFSLHSPREQGALRAQKDHRAVDEQDERHGASAGDQRTHQGVSQSHAPAGEPGRRHHVCVSVSSS